MAPAPARTPLAQLPFSNSCGTTTSSRSDEENSLVPAGSTMTPASLNLWPSPLDCCCTVTLTRHVACRVACRGVETAVAAGQGSGRFHCAGCSTLPCYLLLANPGLPVSRSPLLLTAPQPVTPPSTPLPTWNSAVISIDAFSCHSASTVVSSHSHPLTHSTLHGAQAAHQRHGAQSTAFGTLHARSPNCAGQGDLDCTAWLQPRACKRCSGHRLAACPGLGRSLGNAHGFVACKVGQHHTVSPLRGPSHPGVDGKLQPRVRLKGNEAPLLRGGNQQEGAGRLNTAGPGDVDA